MWNLVLTGVSGILLGVLFSMKPLSPERSQFACEEKVLERVIRNEFLLKDTLEKITEIRMKIMDDNVKLNEALNAQLEVTKKKLDDSINAFVDTAVQHVSGAVKEINTSVKELVETTVDKVDIFIAAATNKMTLVDTVIEHFTEAGEEIYITVNALVESSTDKVDTFIAAATKNMTLVDTFVQHVSGAAKEIDTTAKALVNSTLDKVDTFIVAAKRNMTEIIDKVNSTNTSFVEPKGQGIRHKSMVQVRRTDVSNEFEQESGVGEYTYGVNETVVFEVVMLNDGGGYDRETGHFKAPEAGEYMFTLQYCSIKTDPNIFQIVHGGRVLSKSMQVNGKHCLSVLASAILALGDKVLVRSTSEVEVPARNFLCFQKFSVMIVRL